MCWDSQNSAPVRGPAPAALSAAAGQLSHRWWAAGMEAALSKLSMFVPWHVLLQLYTFVQSPSLSHLELSLGFCLQSKHTERFTAFVRGQISVVLGWEAWFGE